MFSRILLPLDGSQLAESAIPHAELFARIFGANIVLLQVLEPTSYHENPQAIDPLSWQIRKADADMYLQGIADRISTSLGTAGRVTYALREGKTAENIVDVAHAENIDLLIISTHGSGGLSRWNISSVTQKVISLIFLPVLIVRAHVQSGSHERIERYRRILLPIDSSRRAECALRAGTELVRGEDCASKDDEPASNEAKLVLASVIRPPEVPIPPPYPAELVQLTEQLLEISRQAVHSYLDEIKQRMPVPCETLVVESSSVTASIHEMANQEDIDMVVLCAHGQSGQTAWPYGTVARHYIEHGTKPVLVIQDVFRSQIRQTDLRYLVRHTDLGSQARQTKVLAAAQVSGRR